MFLRLGQLNISLQSSSAAINKAWEQMLPGWLVPEINGKPDIVFQLEATESLPQLPPNRPYFSDEAGILAVYQGDGEQVHLHYLDGAWIDVPLQDSVATAPVKASGVLIKQAMKYGRFEDITFTTLAPLLRRRGYFLLHAFAASKNGQAVVIAGPTHSGKTTTGLSLLLAGWELLTNDILLVEARHDGIYALPTPSVVGIRPQSLDLLPGLHHLVKDIPLVDGHYNLSSHRVTGGNWAKPGKITAVYFPQIEDRVTSQLVPLNRALALVQLMAESIDHWDKPMLQSHMGLLEQLSQQAKAFTLHLGRNVAALSELLTA